MFGQSLASLSPESKGFVFRERGDKLDLRGNGSIYSGLMCYFLGKRVRKVYCSSQ